MKFFVFIFIALLTLSTAQADVKLKIPNRLPTEENSQLVKLVQSPITLNPSSVHDLYNNSLFALGVQILMETAVQKDIYSNPDPELDREFERQEIRLKH